MGYFLPFALFSSEEKKNHNLAFSLLTYAQEGNLQEIVDLYEKGSFQHRDASGLKNFSDDFKIPQDKDKNTPFHLVCACSVASGNRFECAQVMINFIREGLDVKNKQGNTPLHYAQLIKEPENAIKLTCLFLQHGSHANAQNIWNETPLHLAQREEKKLAACLTSFLLGAHADPNLKTEEGYTPLHYAPGKAAYLLLRAGAQQIKNKNGITPLHLACLAVGSKCIKKETTKEKRAFLKLDNYYQKMCLLLLNGADPKAKDKTGRSAFDCLDAFETSDLNFEKQTQELLRCFWLSHKEVIDKHLEALSLSNYLQKNHIDGSTLVSILSKAIDKSVISKKIELLLKFVKQRVQGLVKEGGFKGTFDEVAFTFYPHYLLERLQKLDYGLIKLLIPLLFTLSLDETTKEGLISCEKGLDWFVLPRPLTFDEKKYILAGLSERGMIFPEIDFHPALSSGQDKRRNIFIPPFSSIDKGGMEFVVAKKKEQFLCY